MIRYVYVFSCRSPASYQAYLLGNSDPEFSVSPSSGELPPVDCNQGALLIISFTPNKYGKVYKGKLVVQVCIETTTKSLLLLNV